MSPSTFALTTLLAFSPLLTNANPINKREEIYKADGDTFIELGENKAQLGDQPTWYVLDSLKENCGSIACDKSWTVPAKFVSATVVGTRNIVVEVQGSYSQEDTSLETLVEALKAVSGVPETYEVTQEKGCNKPCTGRLCELGACGGSGTSTVDLYTTSSRFSIRREGESTSSLNVFLSLEEEEEGLGFCELVTGAGGAIAGAVSGGAGAAAGLGVASVFCGLIPS